MLCYAVHIHSFPQEEETTLITYHPMKVKQAEQ